MEATISIAISTVITVIIATGTTYISSILSEERNYIFTKKDFIMSIAFLTVSLTAVSLMHEFGHIFAAKLWGLDIVKFSVNSTGYRVYLAPPVDQTVPIAQITIAFAGPLINLVVAFLSWYILTYSTKTTVRIISACLLFLQGFEGALNLLLTYTSDSRNFAEGLSRLLNTDVIVINIFMLISFALWLLTILRKIVKEFSILELPAKVAP